ncbi:MAG: hypothetical protein ACRDB3_17930 [Citrobacter telavivensis]
MSIKLHLTIGSKVKNIRLNSSRKGMIGFVVEEKVGERGGKWLVKYQDGQFGTYFKELAHISLKRADGEVTHTCKCVHDELCEGCTRKQQKAISFFQRYHGHPMDFGTAYRDVSMMNTDDRYCILRAFMSVTGQQLETKRRVLKKVRRNVISGKTQDDMVKEMGHARGVQQFNTRCLGLSTGQAMARIADAMMHPTKNVRLWDVDHAITDPNVKAGRHQLNQTFVALVESIIAKNNLVGFQFDLPKQYMSFNPIVTEETYVETH